MSIKKTQKLIDLAKKGGNNADLYILQLIEELESKLEKLDEKMPDLGMFLANVRGEDGVSIEEIEYEDGTLTITNSEGEEFSWYVKGEDAEVTEELKQELVLKVRELIEVPNFDKIVEGLNSKIDKVAQMKNVVEVKETVIEREVIDDSAIEKLKEDNKNYLNDLSKKITEQFPTDADIRQKIKEIMPVNPPDYAGGSGATFIKSMRDVDTKDRSATKAYLKWNPTTKKYEHVEVSGSSVSINGSTVSSPDFIDGNTFEFDVSGTDVTGNVIGVNRVVVSGNTTATLGTYYISVASATYTDPTPTEGGGFTVLVRNGTATVGGTAYSTAGTIIYRYFHSGAWANYVQMPQGAMSGDATQSTTGAVTIANNAVSNAKLAKMASNTLKGNNTGSSDDPDDLTVDEVNKMLDTGPSINEMYISYTNATGTATYKVPGGDGSSLLGTVSAVANTIYLVKFCVQGEWSIGRLGLNVTTGGTATKFHMGIWECDSQGLPATLILDSAEISFTGTGVKGTIFSPSRVLPAGEYCIGVVMNGTATLRGVQFSQPIGLDSALGTSWNRHLRYSFTFGTLGDLTTSSLTFNTGSFPAYGVGLD